MARDEEPVASLAEETLRLVETLLADPGYREHSRACTWCPVCQLVDRVRAHPEIVESLVAAMSLALRAARAFVDQSASETTSGDGRRRDADGEGES